MGDGFVCLKNKGVLGMFHPALYPSYWMVHIAVDPEQWGDTAKPMMKILETFEAEFAPKRIIAWIYEEKSLVIRLAKKTGFSIDGKMPGLVMMGRG